jgi:hypothetical protein
MHAALVLFSEEEKSQRNVEKNKTTDVLTKCIYPLMLSW